MFLAKTYESVSPVQPPTAFPLTHLAELDTHLIVRVDTPDSALYVDLVLCKTVSARIGT